MHGSSLRQSFALLLLSCSWLSSVAARAEEAPAEEVVYESALESMSAPVVVDGSILFKVRGTSSIPAERRAQVISDRIVALAADPTFDKQGLRLESQPDATMVMAGTQLVMVMSDGDARLEGIDRQVLGRVVLTRVGEAIDAWRRDRALASLQRNALFASGATLVLVLALWGGARLFRRLRRLIEERLRQRIPDLQVRGFNIVQAQQLWGLLARLLVLLWVAVVLAALYVYLSSVLALFPWTRGLAGGLVALVLDPLRTLGLGFIKIVPKLAFLVVLFFITRYVLKLIRLFFDSVADGNVVLPEFDPEWAWPTYRLVKILLIALVMVVAYPYIPGSGSEAFKGISIFVGVIFSLGSSSLIGNLIAGYTMNYHRVFKVGDRVRIGEHLGSVDQVRVLVTHLRTLKNEMIAIPNSVILSGEVVNYSTLARQQGLILHTTVGIGYEIPWRQVEAMLLEAAGRTADLLREPPPFVLLKALGDFCITYEINAYCADASAMIQVFKELHRNILDIFNEYGVQIMTPAYEGDPDQRKVVPRENWYAAPARPPGQE